YTDVNGTIFPSDRKERSMWGWYDSMMYGADFDSPNLNRKPTESMVEEISLYVNFNASKNAASETNNEVSIKIDQHIGDWTLDHDVIDGRTQDLNSVDVYLRGNDVLLNRSLAANWYVTAFTDMRWKVSDDKGSTINNEDATESKDFDLQGTLANVSFATVKLGSTYDWYKPIAINDTIRTLNVTSKTTPIGVFEASFQKEDGKSSAGFDISSMMYFLTTVFPKWDGYAVYNDPEIATLVSQGIFFLPLPPGAPFGFFVLIAVALVGSAVTVALLRLRRRRLINPTPIISGSISQTLVTIVVT
ncbi:hypothetical protein KAS14_06250, partial [Candidatus Bathyarchaeota archaeon]|nr:hypothetical protein [Candidatus Bathyarchaeota archaeon]